jgi:O-antigen/teichoic acid export membrane protein
MSTLRRVFRNTSVLIIANALQPLLSFYLVVTISRVLNVDGLGAYSTIFNYQAIFQIFSSFGLKVLLTRNVARQPHEIWRYLWHGSLIALPCSALSMGVLIALTVLLNYGDLVLWATIVVSFSLVAAALSEVCEGVIAGVERLHVIGYSSVVENALRVALSLVLLGMNYGLLALAWVFVASKLAKAIFYYWYIHRRLAPFPSGASLAGAARLLGDWNFTRQLISQARVFALAMICVTIYWKADVSLLSKLRGLDEVGLYTAAYRFLMMALVIVDSFVNSLFPVISNYYRASSRESVGEAGLAAGPEDGKFDLACKKGLHLLMILTLPVAMSLSLLAGPVILLIYGPEYAGAIPVLQILIWVVVPYAISQIFDYALVASNNQRFALWVIAVSMAANLVLNWFLIRRMGFLGAAWAALISVQIYVALQIPFVFREVLKFEGKKLYFSGIKVIIAAGLMAGFILLFSQIKIWFLLPLAFFIYLLSLIGVRAFSRQDWLLATRLLK